MAIVPSAVYPGRVDLSDPTGYPLGAFQNETAPAANDGTPSDVLWGNDLQGFLQALLDEAGITPSGVPDKVGASDYLDSINAILGSSLDADKYYKAEQREADGVDAGGTLAAVFVTRTLNWESGATFASLAANQVTLDAGKYYCRIRGSVNGGSSGAGHQIILRQVTGATPILVVGSSEVAGNTTALKNLTPSYGEDFFTLAGSESVELQHISSSTVAGNGLGAQVGSGAGERYGMLELWKVS